MDQPVTAHARLSPSSAGRWVRCPGSIQLCEQFPDEGSSPLDEEGTATHWITSEALQGRMQLVGTKAPNGIITTIEMVECAGAYVAAVHENAGNLPLVIEQPMRCAEIHSDCWGTPDLWYYNPVLAELHVWDYKHGFGIVEPYENWQLLCYSSGALCQVAAQLKVGPGELDQTTTTVLHICQPRSFHEHGVIREWRQKAWFLRGYVNTLALAAGKALTLQAECLSGGHCKYCSARHACPALAKASMVAIDYCEQARALQLPPDALARELRVLQRAEELIKARRTGIEQQAIGIIQQGGGVPGFALENGKGRRAWNRPVEEVLALGGMMGTPLAAPVAAITPAQAVKLGLAREVVDAYSEVPNTRYKLVPTDRSQAALAFRQ